MGHHSEAFIGIDTAKLRNAVAIAEAGRRGEVRDLGEVDTSEVATRRLVAGLAARYRKLTCAEFVFREIETTDDRGHVVVGFPVEVMRAG